MAGGIYDSCEAVMLTRAQIDLYISRKEKEKKKTCDRAVLSYFLSATVSIISTPEIPRLRRNKEERARPERRRF